MKKPQSLAGLIRQRLADIEARLEVGIRQEVIVDELATEGHLTSLQNFRNELWRARKWKEKKETAQVSNASPANAQPSIQKAIANPVTKKALDSKSVFGDLTKATENKFSAVPNKSNLFEIDDEKGNN